MEKQDVTDERSDFESLIYGIFKHPGTFLFSVFFIFKLIEKALFFLWDWVMVAVAAVSDSVGGVLILFKDFFG